MACTNVRDENGLTEEEYLKKYKPGKYERPSVTVDMLLFGMDAVSYTHLTLPTTPYV